MIYLIAGSSGSGKTTQANILKSRDDFFKIITYTTRPKRPGEVDGVDYFFVDEDEFKRLDGENYFLETTVYSGNFYGTPKSQIEKYLHSRENAVLVVDLNGVKKIKSENRDVICVYLKLDGDSLVGRMLNRGDTNDSIVKRIKVRQDFSAFADYVIDASKSVEEVAKQIKKIVSTGISQRLIGKSNGVKSE